MFEETIRKLKDRGWFLSADERNARAFASRQKAWAEKRAKQSAAFERHEKLWAELKPKAWLVHETSDKAAVFSFVQSQRPGGEIAWTVLIEWDGDRWWGSNWSSEVPRVAPFGYEADSGWPNDDAEAWLGSFSSFAESSGHAQADASSKAASEPVLRHMADFVYANRRERNLLRGLRRIT